MKIKYYNKIIDGENFYVVLTSDVMSRLNMTQKDLCRKNYAEIFNTTERFIIFACLIDKQVVCYHGDLKIINQFDKFINNLNLDWKIIEK